MRVRLSIDEKLKPRTACYRKYDLNFNVNFFSRKVRVIDNKKNRFSDVLLISVPKIVKISLSLLKLINGTTVKN